MISFSFWSTKKLGGFIASAVYSGLALAESDFVGQKIYQLADGSMKARASTTKTNVEGLSSLWKRWVVAEWLDKAKKKS